MANSGIVEELLRLLEDDAPQEDGLYDLPFGKVIVDTNPKQAASQVFTEYELKYDVATDFLRMALLNEGPEWVFMTLAIDSRDLQRWSFYIDLFEEVGGTFGDPWVSLRSHQR